MKHSTYKQRTYDPFKIWIRHVCTIARLFYSTSENEALQTHTPHLDNKLPNF